MEVAMAERQPRKPGLASMLDDLAARAEGPEAGGMGQVLHSWADTADPSLVAPLPAAEAAALTRALSDANGFRADALAANRAGRITPEQAARVRHDERRGAPTGWVVGVLLLAVGAAAVVLFGPGFLRDVTRHRARGDLDALWSDFLAALGVVFCFGFGWIALASARGGAWRRDLREGRVEMVEGVGRKVDRSSGPNYVAFEYVIGEKSFSVGAAGYHALVPGARYRAWYLPHSSHLLNIEAVAADG
jgi:hypothetical protein